MSRKRCGVHEPHWAVGARMWASKCFCATDCYWSGGGHMKEALLWACMHQQFGRYQQQQFLIFIPEQEKHQSRGFRGGAPLNLMDFFFNFSQMGDYLMAVTVVNIDASKDISHRFNRLRAEKSKYTGESSLLSPPWFFVLICSITLFYPHFAHVTLHFAALLVPSVIRAWIFCISFSLGTFFHSGMIRTGTGLDPVSSSGPHGTPFSPPSSAFNEQMEVSEFPPWEFQTASEVAAHKFNHHLLKRDIWVHAPIKRFLVLTKLSSFIVRPPWVTFPRAH